MLPHAQALQASRLVAQMCKWNVQDRQCVHGHTEHEELYNPHARTRPPVIWCNACWTVCASYSYKEVRKGLPAAVSDAFNGTTRAPPYITLFNEAPVEDEQHPLGPPESKSSQAATRIRGPTAYSQFNTTSPMEDGLQRPIEEDTQVVATHPLQNHSLACHSEFEEGYNSLR